MDPRDFGNLALRLAAAEQPSLADLRTSVSRGYYAAFNVAIDFLANLGVRAPAGWEGHKLVAEGLRNCGDDKLSAASRELDDLRKARWAADYDLKDEAVEDHRMVKKWAARSKQVVKKLDECDADVARRTQARVKIQGWVNSAEGVAKGFRRID